MRVVDIDIQQVTFAEMVQALLDLNFKQKKEGDISRFVHKKNDTIVILRNEKANAIIDKTHVIGTAVILEGKGIIRNIDTLAQIIQKNRILNQDKLV